MIIIKGNEILRSTDEYERLLEKVRQYKSQITNDFNVIKSSIDNYDLSTSIDRLSQQFDSHYSTLENKVNGVIERINQSYQRHQVTLDIFTQNMWEILGKMNTLALVKSTINVGRSNVSGASQMYSTSGVQYATGGLNTSEMVAPGTRGTIPNYNTVEAQVATQNAQYNDRIATEQATGTINSGVYSRTTNGINEIQQTAPKSTNVPSFDDITAQVASQNAQYNDRIATEQNDARIAR